MSRYVTSRKLQTLRDAMGERDWQIVKALAVTRVATAAQLEALHFASVTRRMARKQLASLVARRVIARLPRVIGGTRAGSSGYVYALDVAGQHLAGLVSGRRPERPWPVGAAFLAHSLAVTETYVHLSLAERAGSLRVRRFAGEPRSWRTFYGAGGVRTTLKPDAYSVLLVDGYEDHWFFEVDLGTERDAALARQCAFYRAYWQSSADEADGVVFPRVLWLVQDERRATFLRQVVSRQPQEAAGLFDVALAGALVERVLRGAAP